MLIVDWMSDVCSSDLVGRRSWCHPSILVGLGDPGAAVKPVAALGRRWRVRHRLGAKHPVEQRQQRVPVQLGRLHAHSSAFTSIVQRTAFFALAAAVRHAPIASRLSRASVAAPVIPRQASGEATALNRCPPSHTGSPNVPAPTRPAPTHPPHPPTAPP